MTTFETRDGSPQPLEIDARLGVLTLILGVVVLGVAGQVDPRWRRKPLWHLPIASGIAQVVEAFAPGVVRGRPVVHQWGGVNRLGCVRLPPLL